MSEQLQTQIAILGRQYEYLSRKKGVDFIRQARRFYDFLSKNAQYSVLIEDMVSETNQLVEELEQFDETLIPELVNIRKEFQARAPEYDDSKLKRPEPHESSHREYESSLAFFDAHLEGKDDKRGISLMRTPYDDHTKFSTLSGIVSGKIHDLMNGYNPATNAIDESMKREDLQDLRIRIGKLREKHNHSFRSFLDAKFSLPGVAWINLTTTFSEINPDPSAYEDNSERALERALLGYGPILRKALYEPENRLGSDNKSLGDAEDMLRGHCERVYEELRLKLGTASSNIALIRRYKTRCEWHDAARLFEISKSPSAENDLTAELARYLFDQGLNPLTRARTAGLEPDLIDPTALGKVYVEAKQYSKAARTYLTKGIAQVHDTLGRLRGTPYEVTEAFYVVFRLGGPRYIFPDVVHSEGYDIYIVFIDIAPNSLSGTRQKHKPIQISLIELVVASESEDVKN